MTSFDDGLERRLTARLDERAAPIAPVGLAEAIDQRVGATKQRPAWATTERWISMETRAQFGAVPRAVVVLALLALLTLATATAIAVGASIATKPAPPFGAAGNGLIAYVSGGDIWTVNPMGGEPRRLTSGRGVEDIPTWSRDGTKLAYWTGAEGETGELVVIDADGGNAVTVAQTTSRPYSTLMWSADGTEIMYDTIDPALVSDTCPYSGTDDDVACGSRLIVAATDGSGARQVGDPDLSARSPVLSPDGHTVAFGGGGDGGTEALYLMEWDGSDLRRLETGIVGDRIWPFSRQSWSPQGDRLVTHDGNGQLWAVDVDGSGALAAVERLRLGHFPSYAPTGDEVLDRSSGAIFMDGEVGTPASSVGFSGQWSPDATRLVRVENGNLEVFERESGETTVIATVEATPGITGPALYDAAEPSWQRVAP